ncbi:MAG: hypothetical protein LCH82_00325 [Actinobacteria bacterium]|nr:hypothetical protein [Actinomycetota bacterium]
MIVSLPAPADGIEPGSGLGAWLQRLVIGAGLLVLATAALAAPLGYAGWWRPWLVLPLLVLVAGGVGWLVARLPAARVDTAPAAALALVGAAYTAWAAATHSTQILPRRDAGSNLQAAISLADTGYRIVPLSPAGMGAPAVLRVHDVTLGSPAFYQLGDAAHPSIQPQFVIGPAAIYSPGRWLGGLSTMFLQPAVLAGLSVLGLGLIVAVLLRGWWGPVAAASVALQFPLLHTARATYSEPLAELTIVAGALAWVLAARFDHRRLALLAGLLVGGTTLVRIDGLREAILLIPVAALGLIQRRSWPAPLMRGTAIGALGGGAAAQALSYRYLGDIAGSLLPLIALGAFMALVSWALVVLSRRGAGLPDSVRRLLPAACGLGVLVIGLLLALRPLFMTVRQNPNDPGANVVAGLQLRQGLTIDGARTYAEQSVAWLSWWVGPVALVIALLVAAALAAQLGRAWTTRPQIPGRPPALLPTWAGPYVLALGSTLLTLWRPGITPDHPWAERRLLIALPFVAVLVVVGAAWVWRGAATSLRSQPARAGLALLTLASLVIPTALATWPHRSERVEAGSQARVAALCRALQPGDIVLSVDDRAANEWPPVVRGMCNKPALVAKYYARRHPEALRILVDGVVDAAPPGSRVVLLAGESPQALARLGFTPQPVASGEVLEDERLLERRPDGLVPLRIDLWLAPAS